MSLDPKTRRLVLWVVVIIITPLIVWIGWEITKSTLRQIMVEKTIGIVSDTVQDATQARNWQIVEDDNRKLLAIIETLQTQSANHESDVKTCQANMAVLNESLLEVKSKPKPVCPPVVECDNRNRCALLVRPSIDQLRNHLRRQGGTKSDRD